jgi:hypothetical protein
MFNVPIYAQEREDGLESCIQKESSARVLAKFTVSEKIPDLDKIISQLKNGDKTIADFIDDIDQPDLVYMISILVSTGWNLNDDIFLPGETFASRETPVHKPINMGHDDSDIIGHIVQCQALTKDGEIIAEEHPEEFDLEVGGVLYSKLPSTHSDVTSIIKDAEEGRAFVSMECWFGDFGYGFQDPDTGITKVVARQKDTAFLTKHLRAYGGSGTFKGYKVGRVFFGIVFGGMGVVENPANPESIVKEVRQSKALFEKVEIDQITKGGVDSMDKKLETKLEEVNTNLEAKTAEVEKLQIDYAATAEKLEEALKEVASLTETITERSAEISSLKSEITEIKEKNENLNKVVETTEAKLEGIQKDNRAKERLVMLREVRDVEDKEATLSELRDMTDETFEIVLKYAGKSGIEETTDADKSEDEAKETETQDKDNEAQADEAQTEAEKTLDEAESSNEADLQPGDTEEETTVNVALKTARRLLGRDEKPKEV